MQRSEADKKALAEIGKKVKDKEMKQVLKKLESAKTYEKFTIHAPHAYSKILDDMFGTQKPVAGMTVSWDFIQFRGKKGERMRKNEKLSAFTKRCSTIEMRSVNISANIYFMRKMGIECIKDNEKKTVTVVSVSDRYK